jgi:hypothetical protein
MGYHKQHSSPKLSNYLQPALCEGGQKYPMLKSNRGNNHQNLNNDKFMYLQNTQHRYYSIFIKSNQDHTNPEVIFKELGIKVEDY